MSRHIWDLWDGFHLGSRWSKGHNPTSHTTRLLNQLRVRHEAQTPYILNKKSSTEYIAQSRIRNTETRNCFNSVCYWLCNLPHVSAMKSHDFKGKSNLINIIHCASPPSLSHCSSVELLNSFKTDKASHPPPLHPNLHARLNRMYKGFNLTNACQKWPLHKHNIYYLPVGN